MDDIIRTAYEDQSKMVVTFQLLIIVGAQVRGALAVASVLSLL